MTYLPGYMQNKGDRGDWLALAQKQGLEFSAGGFWKNPKLSGVTEKDLFVEVKHENVSGSAPGLNHTDYVIRFEQRGPKLKIRQRILSHAGIETGDPVFDKQFKVSGDDATRVQSFLSERRRSTLVATASAVAVAVELKINDDCVRYRSPGFDDPEAIEATLEHLVGLAMVLTEET